MSAKGCLEPKNTKFDFAVMWRLRRRADLGRFTKKMQRSLAREVINQGRSIAPAARSVGRISTPFDVPVRPISSNAFLLLDVALFERDY